MKKLMPLIIVFIIASTGPASALDCLNYLQADSDQRKAIAAAIVEIEEDIAVEESRRKSEAAAAAYWEVKDAAQDALNAARRAANRAYDEVLENNRGSNLSQHKRAEAAETARFAIMDPAQAEYDRALAPVQAALDKAWEAERAAERRRGAAIEEARKKINAETEDNYINIYSAGRDLSDYSREVVLKMAMRERHLCAE